MRHNSYMYIKICKTAETLIQVVTVAVLFVLVMLSGTACAAAEEEKEKISLQLNGKSWHRGECLGGCNETNLGVGIQWEKDNTLYTVGWLENSVRDTTIYIGGAKRWGSENLKAGFFLGMIRYPSAPINTFPVVLPMASIEFRDVGMNLLYIPAVTEDVTATVLVQLTIKLNLEEDL